MRSLGGGFRKRTARSILSAGVRSLPVRKPAQKFHYTRTRILQLANEESSEEETWGWIDEYEDREAYDKMTKAIEEDTEVVKLKNQWHSMWDPLRVPGSFKAELWTERLRSDLK